MSNHLFQQGLAYHRSGNLVEAKKIYQSVLSQNPHHADSLHLLGLIAHISSDQNMAENLIRSAISINQSYIFYSSLGSVLKAQNRIEDAIESYKYSLSLEPNFSDALNNLGLVYSDLNKFDEAMKLYELALISNPNHVDSLINMGLVMHTQRKYAEAINYYNRAISVNPAHADAYYNLGNTFLALDNKDDAIQSYIRALSIKPHSASHINLATILDSRNLFHDAIEHYERAIAIQPDFNAFINLANSLKNIGKLDEAIKFYKLAFSVNPDRVTIYSNLLLAMVYASSISPEELAGTARVFGERIADPLLRRRSFLNDKAPGRRLRIGYVSADFYQHSVNYFFEPLLSLHDHERFEIYLYSNTPREDAVTGRLKTKADHWRDIRLLDDDKAADLIEADQIDILVDISGHTGHNRLPIFARKPAPVQVTWLGYPATTGMKAMDYRITDVHAEPAGMTEHLNVETLYRLPDIFCCYQAQENSPEVIDHPPFEDNGYITFGCFNNFSKVTDEVLSAWARIMGRVPGSRLLLEIAGIDGAKFRAEVEARLARAGLPLERIIFERRKRENQFVLYNRIDIALDPFPCNGGTTSMDTLWMGVPFVTLAGSHFVSRMGVTILTNAGLDELITNNVDEYIDCAVSLAQYSPRLKSMRHGLRQRVQKSPVMDTQRFTHNIEHAYKKMWGDYND